MTAPMTPGTPGPGGPPGGFWQGFQDIVSTFLNLNKLVADIANTLSSTWSQFVTGPSSSTNNDFVLFDGTTGKAVKDSGFSVVPISAGGSGTTNAPLLVAAVVVDFNAIADYPLVIVIPSGCTSYRIQGFITINTGSTASLTTARFGVFTAAAGGGTALVASGTVLSGLTSNAAGTATSLLVSASAVTAYFTNTTLYYRVTTAQGAAASGKAYIQYQPLP